MKKFIAILAAVEIQPSKYQLKKVVRKLLKMKIKKKRRKKKRMRF